MVTLTLQKAINSNIVNNTKNRWFWLNQFSLFELSLCYCWTHDLGMNVPDVNWSR